MPWRFADRESEVAVCAHCGNRAHHELRAEIVGDPHGEYDDEERTPLYFLAQCITCGQPSLFLDDSENTAAFVDTKLVWPTPANLPRSVPDKVRLCYEGAARIRNMVPNAYAVQLRRALELLCADRGAEGRTLQDKLRVLVEKNEIPDLLAQMSNAVRILGNVGAHAGSEEVETKDVPTLDDFFRAVVEYVYIAPSKLREYQKRLGELRKPQRQPKTKKTPGREPTSA